MKNICIEPKCERYNIKTKKKIRNFAVTLVAVTIHQS